MKVKDVIFFLIFFFLVKNVFAQESVIKRPKVGLVLSGGGAKGLAHIGVLKVLEKEGIHIDYITGTSMGALVGGLYAIGYSADELEQIILNLNWNDLLTDNIPRTDRTIDDRDSLERYILTFPVRGKEISLPRGVVSGQKVSELLIKLTAPVHFENDFSKFKIPFKCIATDIETGLPVVIENGYLPDVLRASMSIPTIYTPIEIKGKLLVDGGLARNLPAEDLKKMGADIIIAVDVNNTFLTKKDLRDLTLITEQTLIISMMEVNKKQRELCNYIIEPDMTGFNTGSFNKVKEIIKSGENAGLACVDEVKRLTGADDKKIMETLPEYSPNVEIDNITSSGNDKISEEFIIRKLHIDIDDEISYEDIESGIGKLFGTGYFERVTYQIKKIDGKNILEIRVVERGTDFFNLGFRYDSDLKASLLMNLTMRGIISQNSMLALDAHLGEYPKLAAEFLFPINFLSFFAVQTNMWYHKFSVDVYEDDKKVIAFDTSITAGSINLQTFTFYDFIFGLGTECESMSLEVDISEYGDIISDSRYFYWNQYVFFSYDHIDRMYFPKKGFKLYSECKYVSDFTPSHENNYNRDTSHDFIRTYMKFESAIPFHRKISLQIDGMAGGIFDDNIPENYMFFFGGMNNIEDRVFEFAGMKYMQVYGNYCQMLSTGFQFELFNIYYITPSAEILRIQNYSTEYYMNPMEDVIMGFSLKNGILTPVGPVELTLSIGKDFSEPLLSFYMGYAF